MTGDAEVLEVKEEEEDVLEMFAAQVFGGNLGVASGGCIVM